MNMENDGYVEDTILAQSSVSRIIQSKKIFIIVSLLLVGFFVILATVISKIIPSPDAPSKTAKESADSPQQAPKVVDKILPHTIVVYNQDSGANSLPEVKFYDLRTQSFRPPIEELAFDASRGFITYGNWSPDGLKLPIYRHSSDGPGTKTDISIYFYSPLKHAVERVYTYDRNKPDEYSGLSAPLDTHDSLWYDNDKFAVVENKYGTNDKVAVWVDSKGNKGKYDIGKDPVIQFDDFKKTQVFFAIPHSDEIQTYVESDGNKILLNRHQRIINRIGDAYLLITFKQEPTPTGPPDVYIQTEPKGPFTLDFFNMKTALVEKSTVLSDETWPVVSEAELLSDKKRLIIHQRDSWYQSKRERLALIEVDNPSDQKVLVSATQSSDAAPYNDFTLLTYGSIEFLEDKETIWLFTRPRSLTNTTYHGNKGLRITDIYTGKTITLCESNCGDLMVYNPAKGRKIQ